MTDQLKKEDILRADDSAPEEKQGPQLVNEPVAEINPADTQPENTEAEKETKKNKKKPLPEPATILPKRVLLQKTFVLCLKMPGSSGAVMRSFKEGQIVYDPEAIAMLIEHDAPLELL